MIIVTMPTYGKYPRARPITCSLFSHFCPVLYRPRSSTLSSEPTMSHTQRTAAAAAARSKKQEATSTPCAQDERQQIWRNGCGMAMHNLGALVVQWHSPATLCCQLSGQSSYNSLVVIALGKQVPVPIDPAGGHRGHRSSARQEWHGQG